MPQKARRAYEQLDAAVQRMHKDDSLYGPEGEALRILMGIEDMEPKPDDGVNRGKAMSASEGN